MPELPEVESIRRSLWPRLVGHRVHTNTLHRPDVLRGEPAHALPVGGTIREVRRHGKELALLVEPGNPAGPDFRPSTGGDATSPPATPRPGDCLALCVHLGMSGSLTCVPTEQPMLDHTHASWDLDHEFSLRFRDPRRFGGLWAFASLRELRRQRWARRGPDAMRVRATELFAALTRTTRDLKVALLDQGLVAGLGNIYVDEILFAARLAPHLPACLIRPEQCRRLVRVARRVLRQAIAAGGSTLRDYVDGEGHAGGFQAHHHVYGRGDSPCHRCRQPLASTRLAGRATVFCPRCQATPAQAKGPDRQAG